MHALKSLSLFGLILLESFLMVSANGSQPIDKKQWYEIREKEQQLSASNTTVVTDPRVDWPVWYGVQQSGKVEMTFDCFGTLGTGFHRWLSEEYGWPQSSFNAPAGSNVKYLWGGALWIGGVVGQDTLVSLGADGWFSDTELLPTNIQDGSLRGTVTQIPSVSDFAMRAEFTDTADLALLNPYPMPHTPLGIIMALRSHVWRQPGLDNIVLFDLVITNVSDQTIRDASVGLYMDTDIHHLSIGSSGGYLDDLTGSRRDEGIAYAIDNDGDPIDGQFVDTFSTSKAIAAKFLRTSFAPTDTSYNWWLSSFAPSQDFAPRMRGTPSDPFRDFGTEGGLGTPMGDSNKYYILSHHEWDYDQIQTGTIGLNDSVWLPPDTSGTISWDIGTGRDTRFLLSIGVFDLLPDSSARVLFAVFVGDAIHQQPTNPNNLPYDPATYLANLDFTNLLLTASVADSLSRLLVDPLTTPTGLHISYEDEDSAVIEWDPHVFPDVDGYNVYLEEISPDSLPYPGLPAPWLRPINPSLVAGLGRERRYRFDTLSTHKMYICALEGRSNGLSSELCDPVVISLRKHIPAPVMHRRYAFVSEYEGVSISWSAPAGEEIAHYRLYRFDDSASAIRRYLPFYDRGFRAVEITPADTFVINDTVWYYYAMQPYAILPPSLTEFTVDPDDEAAYVVTAVDIYGFESLLSEPTTILHVPPRSRDILVINQTVVGQNALVVRDSILAFYQSILGEYSWDFFDVGETLRVYNCPEIGPDCFDWHDLMPYRLVIIDDDFTDVSLSAAYERQAGGYTRYVHSDGTLAYFGSLSGINDFSLNSSSRLHPVVDPFAREYMGIDSVFFVSPTYYFQQGSPPYVDSLFAFSSAEPTAIGFGELHYDYSRNTFTDFLHLFWPESSPPSVSVFVPNEQGEPSYLYRSTWPTSSIHEGKTVGVHGHHPTGDVHTFGFHLWYMDLSDARALVDELLRGTPTAIGGESNGELPDRFQLRQNYPNPFNPATTIEFDLPHRSNVRLELFNILGQQIMTLIDGSVAAGHHTIEWDGRIGDGSAAATGLYLYRLTTSDGVQTRKMLLLK